MLTKTVSQKTTDKFKIHVSLCPSSNSAKSVVGFREVVVMLKTGKIMLDYVCPFAVTILHLHLFMMLNLSIRELVNLISDVIFISQGVKLVGKYTTK